MDNFKEEVVVRKGGKALGILYLFLAYAMMVFFFVVGMIGLTSVMNLEFNLGSILRLLLGFGACWFLWRWKDNINVEYEYTFTSGEMDFAKVLNGRRRRALMTLRVKDAEAGGVAEGERFARYDSMRDIRKIDMTLNADSKKYFLFFIKEGGKQLLTMECSDEMWAMIVKDNPKLTA